MVLASGLRDHHHRRHRHRLGASTVKRLPSLTSKGAVRLHRTLQWTWALLLIPTLLWWTESILWVAFMSLYANFVGHASAAEAAEGKVMQEQQNA